jgi:hypothetical protein
MLHVLRAYRSDATAAAVMTDTVCAAHRVLLCRVLGGVCNDSGAPCR